MSNIRLGDLAVVVQGLWPNVGRIVYVADAVFDTDFKHMGVETRNGWRVRSFSGTPLQRTDGPGMVGLTPAGSLRPLDRLPTRLQAELDASMAIADLADYFAESEKVLDCDDAIDIDNTMDY